MMDVCDVSQLRSKRCLPCEGGVEPCTLDEARRQLQSLPEWSLSEDGKRIVRRWTAKNFMAAIEFFNAVAALAEAEAHHPDLHLEAYRRVRVEIWTHAIDGLSENDFILAAKIDALPFQTAKPKS